MFWLRVALNLGIHYFLLFYQTFRQVMLEFLRRKLNVTELVEVE